MNRALPAHGLAVVAVVLQACAQEPEPTGRSADALRGMDVDVLVTVGSPPDTFPRNAQNEPALAFDPIHPQIVVVGTNDAIDRSACVFNGTGCAPQGLVGGQGVYFSLDGGRTWTQPTYSGWSDRSGTPGVGPIGTVPNYYENGMVTGSDPALAFGPRPGPDGFRWENGSRL